MSDEKKRAYGRSRFLVGEPLPAALTNHDFADLLGVSHTRITQLLKSGALARFELERIGPRVRYSGKRIQDWLEGERGPVYGSPTRRRWPGAR